VDAHRPGEVGHHHHGALEDADQQDVLVRVVDVHLAGHLAQARLQGRLVDEDVLEV